MAYSLAWLLMNYPGLKKGLEASGRFDELRPFRFLSWRHGTALFTAKDDLTGNDCFVKTGGWMRTASREAEAIKRFTLAGGAAPRLLHVEPDSYPDYTVTELLDGSNLSETDGLLGRSDEDCQVRIVEGLAGILDALYEAGLVHRDINLKNLMLGEGPEGCHVHLVDFAFAESVQTALPSIDENRYYQQAQKRLGAGLNPVPGVWDDAYSAYRTALKVVDHERVDLDPLKSRIGRLTFRCDNAVAQDATIQGA